MKITPKGPYNKVKSLWHSNATGCSKTWPFLFEVIACSYVAAKVSSKPMLAYSDWHPKE